jgi:integrase/recombinase XerC
MDYQVKFKEYLTRRSLSSTTIRGYLLDVNQCLKNNITDRKLSFFDSELLLSLGSPSSSRRRWASLNKYSKFLNSIGIKTQDLEDLELPKVNAKIPKILSKKEALQIIGTEQSIEIRVALHIMYSTGCRIGSLASLKIEDIKEDSIVFNTAKGDKPYVSILTISTKKLVESFIKDKKTGYLFVTKLGKQLTPDALRLRIRRAMGDNYVNPHTWRHSIATELVGNGVDINTVRDLLNHSSISTTQRYIHLTTEMKMKELAKGHPLL